MQIQETITETHLVLHLFAVPKERVQNMVAKLKVLAQGQTETLEMLKDFEKFFLADYKIDSPIDRDREEAAHALLFFRKNGIEYTMLTATKKVPWLNAYKELNEIVSAILPPEIDAKTFIIDDEKVQQELRLRYRIEQAIKRVLPLIKEAFQKLENEYYDMAEAINQLMEEESFAIQTFFEKLNDDRFSVSQELYEVYSMLTKDITAILSTLGEQLKEMQDLGKTREAKHEALNQILNACEAKL